MFALRLFGGLSLESSTGAIPVGASQRRRLTLLALLSLSGDRGMSRERLQAFLWPESSPERARHALDQLLYATRRDLGADAIISTPTELRLNPAVIQTDAGAFDEAIREARWDAAVERYTGPVLDGLHLVDSTEFERWLDGERERREGQYRRALEAMALAATARGDLAEAVQWWRRRAAAEPLSSSAALSLMRALAAADDRAGAVQHARIHQQLVRTSLEIEPDPAVGELARELGREVPGAAREAGSNTASGPPVVRPRVSALERSDQPAARAALVHAGAGGGFRFRARLAGAGLVTLGLLMAGILAWSKPGVKSLGSGTPPFFGRGESTPARSSGRLTSPPGRPPDAEAHAHYLRARSAWERRTEEGLEQAVVLFRRAAERDPTYAAAYAGLAQSYAMLGYFGFGPARAMFPKAAAAARRAIALDSGAGEAYAALGQALAWEHAWVESERAYLRALELTPDDATVHQWYALLLAYLGRSPEGALHTGHASRIDPLSVQINNMHGMMLYYAGNLRGALEHYERTVDAEPDSAWVRQNPWVLCNFGRVLAAAGRHTQAMRLIERAIQTVPTHPRPLLDLAHVHVLAGHPERARAVFARADTAHPHYVVYRGMLHALLGELDEAFALLEREREWPLPSLVQLNGEARYAPLRNDARFARIRHRLGMPVR